MSKRIIAFPYYGGKNSQLGWLLPLLPYNTRYVEPFGGSAAVLLNRERSPIEVYNDLNEDVVNFFRVLREQHDELRDLLYLTPYAKTEFHNSHDPTDDPLEKARRFFVHSRQAFMGMSRTWATGFQIRKGWSQMISRWLGGIDKLEDVVTRLTGVLIECRPALKVIENYDCSDTVQYLDPPYMLETRTAKEGYTFELERQDHVELLELVLSCDSKFAISGYDNDLYNSMLKDWFRFEDKVKQLAGPRGFRQEILWTNYDPLSVSDFGQTTLENLI